MEVNTLSLTCNQNIFLKASSKAEEVNHRRSQSVKSAAKQRIYCTALMLPYRSA